MYQSSYDLRGHCYKLATQRCRLEVRRNYFSQRVVGPWNRLPSQVVEATTVNTLKNRFDRLRMGHVHKASRSFSSPSFYKLQVIKSVEPYASIHTSDANKYYLPLNYLRFQVGTICIC